MSACVWDWGAGTEWRGQEGGLKRGAQNGRQSPSGPPSELTAVTSHGRTLCRRHIKSEL